ncbi:ubiquitin carboxyl-terminal hydrolase 4 [Limosa lapponica baueri]|uniref:Ubiquitin carboxyl-terminal hydrolase 4 n=1 Tax=Limosa lapponica baueri TaxID=1758121 RepID=A0A2I0TH31_LIMLA|nr:ubiquitin carboxyl-terminal hydrolase 4 [Limosa lapponica baueri]
MVEMINSNLNTNQTSKDPDEVQCMWSTWCKFAWSAPTSYASILSIMSWTDMETPTVDGLARQLKQFEENLSSSLQACVSAVETFPTVPAIQRECLLPCPY